MYISDINLTKESKKFFFITIFTIIFSAIYECFSHSVISLYMILAFIFPLVFGCVFYILLNKQNIKISNINIRIHNSLIITLLLCSIVKGILDIFGTTNSKIIVYIYLSIILLIFDVLIFVKKNCKKIISMIIYFPEKKENFMNDYEEKLENYNKNIEFISKTVSYLKKYYEEINDELKAAEDVLKSPNISSEKKYDVQRLINYDKEERDTLFSVIEKKREKLTNLMRRRECLIDLIDEHNRETKSKK